MGNLKAPGEDQLDDDDNKGPKIEKQNDVKELVEKRRAELRNRMILHELGLYDKPITDEEIVAWGDDPQKVRQEVAESVEAMAKVIKDWPVKENQNDAASKPEDPEPN